MTLMIVQLASEDTETEQAPVPDEVLHLEKFPGISEEPVKKAAVEFLEYLAETGPLPPDAKKVLDAAQAEKPKPQAQQPQTQTERLQKKLQERQAKQKQQQEAAAAQEEEGATASKEEDVDLDALVASIEGKAPPQAKENVSPKKKAKKKKNKAVVA